MDDQNVEKDNDTLLIAMVQAQDADNAVAALEKLNLSVTRLPSQGGFLGRRNVSLLVGLPESHRQDVVGALKENCRRRVEYISVAMESAPMPLPSPIPVTIGGATIFALQADHFEEI